MSATFLAWVGVAFFETAMSGGVALLNKHLLTCLDPVATNMLVRGVSVVTIVTVTAPLTLLGEWSLTYDMTWEAAGYITILAVVGWLIAQNFYYFALRSGRVSVVIPVVSTDLLFTALFAVLFIGGGLGPLTVVGLFVAVAGVSAIARAERLDAAQAAHAPCAAEVADVPDVVVTDGLGSEPVPLAPPLETPVEPHGLTRSVPIVVLLALASAAGWGLAPVLIQLAQRSVGGTTVTMIVQAQGMGLLMIMGIAMARHAPLTTRRLTAAERRRARRLVIITGMIEGSCAILYYLIVEHLGPVQSAVIVATSPIFAILWSALFLRERLSRRLAVGVVITLVGVFLATAERLG